MGTQTARTAFSTATIEGNDCAGGQLDDSFQDQPELSNNCSGPVDVTEYVYPNSENGFAAECYPLEETCPVGTVLEGNGGPCTLNGFGNILFECFCSSS